MINVKTIIAIIICAMLIGVLYVLFEKNIAGEQKTTPSKTSFTQKSKIESPQPSSLIPLPSQAVTLEPISASTDLLKEVENSDMQDYSTAFADLKKAINK